jgi:hypothetical protein
MKNSYLRAGIAALACAAALSACGGSSGSLLLGGRVTGVTKDGLVLQNNGGHDYAITAASLTSSGGTFYFPDLISIDETYNVTVKAIPTNNESCNVVGGTGRSAFNVGSVQVVCTLKTHALTGTVVGLGNATGLELVNGQDRKPVAAGATTFAMDPVGEDVPFGVTVLTQPAGLNCSVAGGARTMGSADVTDVVVTCAPAQS